MSMSSIPPIIGRDTEVANFLEPADGFEPTGPAAARLLLRAIDGVSQGTIASPRCACARCRVTQPVAPVTQESAYNPQDVDRKFLLDTGGCVYIDLNHLEFCLPETRSARDHLAAYYAHLDLVRQAQLRVNETLGVGRKVTVLINNSDGRGHSYGNHLSFSISRRAYDAIFDHKLQLLLSLASFQVALVVLSGQGKVGSENGQPQVDFQISQRADYFEAIVGEQTTYRRPIVNARDEALSGPWQRRGSSANSTSVPLARLHVIFFDATLCPVANYLTVGLMQIFLVALAEERVDQKLVLDAPLDALRAFSHDPTLEAKAQLFSGPSVSAIELLRRFLDSLSSFVAAGGCDGVVPEAKEIMTLADDTLSRLEGRDWPSLAGRLDWVLKWAILQKALEKYPNLSWRSPQLKHLDHLYSSLDPNEGLFWAQRRAEAIEEVVEKEHVCRRRETAPDDTRAALRATILRAAGPRRVQYVDWDRVQIRMSARGGGMIYRTVWLADPARVGSAEPAGDELSPTDLYALLDNLGATRQDKEPCRAPMHANVLRNFFSTS